MQMDTYFDSLTSSMRYADLFAHIKHLKPHAFVFCMDSENREEIGTIINLRKDLKKFGVPLIIISTSDDYAFYNQIRGNGEDLVILKPIPLARLEEKLLTYLNQNVKLEDTASATHEAASVTNEATLAILSELEKELENVEKNIPASISVPQSNGTQRVMIIDDAPCMLKAINEHLGGEYEVATAISGKVAFKYLKKKTVDLILLDYEMPEENGPAVLAKLRANPQTANIPVLFLTGINDASKIQKALSLKPNGYLLKPVDHDTLLAKVHEVLG